MSDTKEISLRLRIEGISNESAELAKLEVQLKALNEERRKFMDKASSKGIISNEDKLILAAYDRDVKQTTESIRGLKKVIDSAPDSLNRMRQKLIEMKNEYANASETVRNKMAPAILELNNKVLAGEKAIGVYSRNVGNYPQIMGTAAGGVKELTSAVGGNTAAVGDAITSFATAGGAAGVFTVAMGTLAAAWKRVQENIELYLKSADKLQYSFAGYERDSEKALDDYRKRLRGQEAAGIEAEMNARAVLVNRGHLLTEEEKEGLRVQIEKGQLMQTEARTQLNLLHQEVERGKWKIEYNRLLQEEERLSDQKLENETKWEGLEAELVKQREIVTDQESTAAQKAAAAVEADKIALQLKTEKTTFIDQELATVQALAKMTGTQEVVEDRVNSLLRERNTIQKEYYSDKVKINRLENAADKATGKSGKAVNVGDVNDQMTRAGLDMQEDFQKEADKQYEAVKVNEDRILEYTLQSITDQEKAKTEAGEREIAEKKKKNGILEKLQAEHEQAKLSIAGSFANLVSGIAGKNKTLQKASLVADKGVAVAEIILQTRKANAALLAWGALGGPVGMALATAARIKNNIAAGIDIAAITAATITALAGFYKGGYTGKGGKYEPAGVVHRGEYVVPSEMVSNPANAPIITALERQRITIMGSRTGISSSNGGGYAEGGYVSSQYSMPIAQPSNMEFNRILEAFNNRIDRLEVHNDLHKVRSGLAEIETINKRSLI